MKMLKVIHFIFLFFPLLVSAFNPLDVVINEICWMGTKTSSADEWIELYNKTNQDINLDGWGLYKEGGKTLIEPLTGTIKAKSYYLIERTDDSTISNIPASQEPSSWGGYGLKNSGEHLQLLDQNSAIIDEINCIDGWFAGDNSTKATMERRDSLVTGNNPKNWQTSKNPGGTPKTENSLGKTDTELEPGTVTTSIPTSTKNTVSRSESKVYPQNIFINEVLPSPEGSDAKNEWIEIFNGNNFEVDISNWKIQDTIGNITTYSFPEGTKIKAKGFLVLARPQTKITLQNSGDTLNLIQPDGIIIDTITYRKAPLNQSYNRTESDWQWSTVLTLGSSNIISTPQQSKEKIQEKETEIKVSEDKPLADSEIKKKLAAIGEQIPESSKESLHTFLIALGIAVVSGILVLFLKKKFETEKQL